MQLEMALYSDTQLYGIQANQSFPDNIPLLIRLHNKKIKKNINIIQYINILVFLICESMFYFINVVFVQKLQLHPDL
jgi:hypothetical protein